MTWRVLALGAGAPRGSAEILARAALRAAAGADVTTRLIRVDELRLEGGSSAGVHDGDDSAWLWEELLSADALIVSAPIFTRMLPGQLKLVVDRLLGPNADHAIVESLLAMRADGHEPAVAFRVDERVLKPRVAGLIAVGGALTSNWQTLALASMHALTFSMQTAVVDQMLVTGAGTPRSVVLDASALERAAQLGRHVASQLGRAFDDAAYLGEPGLCPMCHLDVVALRGGTVECAACGAHGRLTSGGSVEWTDLSTSVISLAEKRAHWAEILATAEKHAEMSDLIAARAAHYESPGTPDPLIRPTG